MLIGSLAGRDTLNGLTNNWKLPRFAQRSTSRWRMLTYRAAWQCDMGPHGRKRFP
jgi:hypothetical protein